MRTKMHEKQYLNERALDKEIKESLLNQLRRIEREVDEIAHTPTRQELNEHVLVLIRAITACKKTRRIE